MNNDVLRTLLALNPGVNQQAPMLSNSQQNQFLSGQQNANMSRSNWGSLPQYQQPSWLDVFNQTLLSGNMMPQQSPFNQYANNMLGFSPMQKDPNWWQRGLTGTGNFLSQAATPITQGGALGLSGGLPVAPYVLGGGILAGGLGSLLQYLGNPGTVQ